MKLFNKNKDLKITIELSGKKLEIKLKHLMDESFDSVDLGIKRNYSPLTAHPVLQMLEIRARYIVEQLIEDTDEFRSQSEQESIALARKSGVPEDIIKLVTKQIKEEKKDDNSKATSHIVH